MAKHEFHRSLGEITRKTEALAGRSIAAKAGSIVRLKSVRVPEQRKAVKAGYDFVTSDRMRNLRIWDFIWNNTSYMEVMNQALYFYQHVELVRQELDTIVGWADRCACWEHADDLAKIYADVVEANPAWILPTLKRWNRSPNPWKRRKSMTSLIEYAAKRRRFLPYSELVSYVEPLLEDDDYYVQKGLGWTLREIGNAYPQEFSAFMTKHASVLKPNAWTGATKNLSTADKNRYKQLRSQRQDDKSTSKH